MRRGRRISALEAANASLLRQLDTAKRQAADFRSGNVALATRASGLDDRTLAQQRHLDALAAGLSGLDADRRNLTGRLARTVRACARYLAALDDQARRVRALERQLDDAMGYNPAQVHGLDAGDRWQDRRQDTARVRPTHTEPGPGVVA